MLPSVIRYALWWMFLFVFVAECTAAQRYDLQAPLTTLIPSGHQLTGNETHVEVEVEVPLGAPSDIGVGVYVCDAHGLWYQQPLATLGVGRHRWILDLRQMWQHEPTSAPWLPLTQSRLRSGGVFAWSATPRTEQDRYHCIVVHSCRFLTRSESPASVSEGIEDLELQGMGEDGVAYAHTGERWECAFRPRIWPQNPYDPDEYSAILHITDPNGDTIQRRAFYFEAMQSFDRGDKEIVEADGFVDFRIRFRPRMPGRHTCVLHIQRDTGTRSTYPVAGIEAQGAAWDDYVRVDAHDPRFYARGTGDSSSIWWPVGLNIAAPPVMSVDRNAIKQPDPGPW